MGRRKIIIKPAKNKSCPGSKNFVRPVISDRPYDLEPADPIKPTINVLNNDVLLYIFRHFDFKELMKIERGRLIMMFSSDFSVNNGQNFNQSCINSFKD